VPERRSCRPWGHDSRFPMPTHPWFAPKPAALLRSFCAGLYTSKSARTRGSGESPVPRAVHRLLDSAAMALRRHAFTARRLEVAGLSMAWLICA